MAIGIAASASAQYDEAEPADTVEAVEDTLPNAPVEAVKELGPDSALLEVQRIQSAVHLATTWVRRLLLRGWMNPTTIGAYATYSLTSWSEGTGSYGPVEARVTMHYLGPAEWLNKEAETLQAAVQFMDAEQTLIEYDFVLPATQRVTEIYRALYRVDRGDVLPTKLELDPGQLDYDAVDKPVTAGRRIMKVYAGEFDTEMYRGSGTDGSEVIIFRSAAVPPLEILVLGYGNEGLTYSSGGNNPTPRFKTTLPPSR